MKNKIQSLLDQAESQKQSAEDGASTVTSARREFSEISVAEDYFVRLKEKLLQIRKWNAESGLTKFELFDENGNLCQRETAVVNDFIRLSLAGSGKNDWVKIAEIYESSDQAVVTVKPSLNPTEKQPDQTTISHFYTDRSNNNFCLEKQEKTINFYVIGLSEITNTAETKNFFETIRNVATSNVGYYLGIQKAEWKLFCENFLEIKK